MADEGLPHLPQLKRRKKRSRKRSSPHLGTHIDNENTDSVGAGVRERGRTDGASLASMVPESCAAPRDSRPTTPTCGHCSLHSTDSTDSTPPPLSFASFLRAELEVNMLQREDGDVHRERVYNFLALPFQFEKLMWFGFGACLESFLFLFTYGPLRAILSLRLLLLSLIKGSLLLDHRAVTDLLRSTMVVVAFYSLNLMDISFVYHYVRHQSVIKVYVLFNMLQIIDKMFCSFGEDILDALYASSSSSEVAGTPREQQSRRLSWAFWTCFHLTTSCIYIVVHSTVLFVMVVTLNVSLNSNNNSLFVVLVSNNFMELKSSVFKRFRIQNLFQLACSDIVERFQLIVFLVTIIIQNISHVGLVNALLWLNNAGVVCVYIFVSEMLVDWVKHGFMTKFNLIHPAAYKQYRKILCCDYTAAHTDRQLESLTHTHPVCRRVGFVPIPLFIVVVRVVAQGWRTATISSSLKIVIGVFIMFVVLALKILTSIVLLGVSTTSVLQQQSAQSAQARDYATAGHRRDGSVHPSLMSNSPEAHPLQPAAIVTALSLQQRRMSRRSFSLGQLLPLPEEAPPRTNKSTMNPAHTHSHSHTPQSAPARQLAAKAWTPLPAEPVRAIRETRASHGAHATDAADNNPIKPSSTKGTSGAARRKRRGTKQRPQHEPDEQYGDLETLKTLAATDRYALQGSRVPL